MESRPSAAFALSLVGGLLILVGGIVSLFLVGSLVPFVSLSVPFLIFSLIGLASGALVIVGGIMAYVRPGQSVIGG